MNVQELRSVLDGYPDDMLVTVDGYEGGITQDITPVSVDVLLDVNTEGYYGEHEVADAYAIKGNPDAERKTVLLLSRHTQ